jgi:transcription antitermination factor NusG
VTAAGSPVPAEEARWFAIRVQSNKEDSVKRNLERKVQLRGLTEKFK